MNILREYMEREIRGGYDGGDSDEGDYYVTVTSATGNSVTIDERGTAAVEDDLIGTIAPDPYYPLNIEDASGDPLTYQGVPYKVIGFTVTWQEDATGQICSERALTYVCYHSSA
ncbi:MAG: hypothetical protein JXB40_03315 [Candidatus Omnitrophica bacterium]|nr:hypothetical protein [Candidatus Omnitrophota bacterium]